MSLSVSKRLARVKPSATGAALALAAELRAAGRDIIALGAGEPDFDTPEPIRNAAKAAIDAGATRYTATDGSASLKQAIRDKFLRDNGLAYSLSEILVSSGAKQSLFNLCMALLGPGDEAIVPVPYWVSYPEMIRLSGASPVFIGTGIEGDFRMTPAQLDAALSARSRLVILNSPSNPTGSSYSKADFEALGEVLQGYPDVAVVSDEIYEHIHWGEEEFVSFASACPGLRERVVTVNGVSKAYAMTGWRIGYAAGPEALIAAMTTVQGQSTTNPCSVSQRAAEAALNGDQAVVREMADAYRRRHDLMVAGLNDIPGFECRPGQGTFYAFPRVTQALAALDLGSDIELAEFLLNEADVAVVPGSAFGAPGYLRLSFACSAETVTEALRRIKRAVAA